MNKLPPGWEEMLGLKPKEKPKTPEEEAREAFRLLSLKFPPKHE